jgi:hypothetical protein
MKNDFFYNLNLNYKKKLKMATAWIARRLQIKNIIKKYTTPQSTEKGIFENLKIFNVTDTEFETYKMYIADLIYEAQMIEYLDKTDIKIVETKTEKYKLGTVGPSHLRNTLGITELCADGHCVPKIGAKGYGRVTDQVGNPLLHLFDLSEYKTAKVSTPKGEVDAVEVYSADTPNQQINYAEIIALHLGLRIALFLDVKIINIDSVTSNAWSSGRISKNIADPTKIKICEEAFKYRKQFERNNGIIRKIDGGKNPADFYMHK